MARSFFMLYPACTPQNFKTGVAPALLTHQDLWSEARVSPPALIFRVRTETGEPGGNLQVGDKLESCIGLVDSATRWRAVFGMGRIMLNAIRTEALAAACWKAANFISSQHPANVTTPQRSAIHAELTGLVKQLMEQGEVPRGQLQFEAQIAFQLAMIAQTDNDYDAATLVPFERALCPYDEKSQQAQFGARMTTLDTISGSILLAEAQNRLAERIPQWMYVPMPELIPPGAEQRQQGQED